MEPGIPPAEVVAVVIMFNSFEEVSRCVGTLLAQEYPRLRVLVVNNGSTDDASSQAHAAFDSAPRVEVADLPANRGFSGGANAGLALALERQPAYVWLLTDDVELHPRAATHLVQALQDDPAIGLAGQYILDRARPDTLYYGGGLFSPRGAIHELKDQVVDIRRDLGPARDTDYATGASMFWRAEALVQTGWMDESYWLYWEDADLSHRARLAGWRVVVVPNALAWHDVTPADDPSMPLRTRYSVRNELRFQEKFRIAPTTWKALRKVLKDGLARLLRGRLLRGAAALGALDHLMGRTGPIRGRW